MKHVSVIVPNGAAVLSSIVGPYKLLHGVNQFLMQSGKRNRPLFNVDLVGVNEETALYEGIFTIKPTKSIQQVTQTDLIIITSLNGDIPFELQNNAAFIPWIKQQRLRHQTELASLCTGAFLLASTGLLDGKSCSTHWHAAPAFRQLFPQVHLLENNIITEDDGIYSSGGAFSFLNLLLHLIEKYAGREAAIWCAKMYEVEFDRSDQNQFVIFNGQKDHADDTIRKAQQYIEKHVQRKISIEQLAEYTATSTRNFIRRFKKATSNTPLEYIQRVKIEAAKKSLESSTNNVTDVMYAVGYSDNKAFRTIFKKFTGMSPIAYRNKYNRVVAMS